MKKILLLLIAGFLLPICGNGQISFFADNTTVCYPASVNFTNTSSVGVSYNWNFGDGGSVNGVTNPSYTFSSAGVYTVTMTALDGLGFPIGTAQVTIDSHGPSPYISAPLTACPNDMVGFWTPVSGTDFSWDFGDDVQAFGQDPFTNHTYTTNGVYTILMTYYDPYCGQSYATYSNITIDNSLPYFGGLPGIYLPGGSTVCPDSPVDMHVNGGTYQSYDWDFGNGDFDTESHPQTEYSSLGVHTISVDLVNGCGVDTTLTTTINVDNTTPAPIVNIGGVPEVCVGSEFFLHAFGPAGLEYTWNFDDGSPLYTSNEYHAYHEYAAAGIYNVHLLIENGCGNTSDNYYTVEASTNAPVYNPNYNISPNVVCPGDEVNFSVGNDYTFYVDFGDGTGQSGNGGSNHAYDNVGIYPVYIIFQNECGSTLTVYDTINVQMGLPVSNNLFMGISPDQVCPGADIKFNAPSGFSSYAWTFGDGYTSNYQEVSHPYANDGNYPVSVTLVNGCGADTTLYDIAEVLDNLPVDNVEWGVFSTEICPGNDLYVGLQDEHNSYTAVWDFGDGSTSTEDLTSHSYDLPGTYAVTLTVTNGCGSDSTLTQNVLVSNSVVPDISLMDAEIQSPGVKHWMNYGKLIQHIRTWINGINGWFDYYPSSCLSGRP